MRIADEQQAFYFYVSASAWCQLNGYENSGCYFQMEARQEAWHYQRIIDFLTDWNVDVAGVQQMAGSMKSFTGLQNILEQQYQLEAALLKKYEADAVQIFGMSQVVFPFIQDFVNTQTSAVREAMNNLKKMENYLKTDPLLVLFDQEVFQNYNSSYY